MLNNQPIGEWYSTLVTYTGSEKPSLFARVHAENLPIEPYLTDLLIVGSGSGVDGISAAIQKHARTVTFNDRLPEWMDITRRNVEIKVKEGAIQPTQVSFTAACSFRDIPGEVIARHTLMAFNPPQLPTAYVEDATLQRIANNHIQSAFRIGGTTGFDVVRDFLEWYASLRAPKPDTVINLSAFLGESRIANAISSCGLREVSRKETRIPLRSLFSREKIDTLSPAELKDRSLEPDGSGWWTKNLLTLRIAGK